MTGQPPNQISQSPERGRHGTSRNRAATNGRLAGAAAMLTHGVGGLSPLHHWRFGLLSRHTLRHSGRAAFFPHSCYSRAVKGSACSVANHALQRTRPLRSGCNRTPSWAGSLSLGRSAEMKAPVAIPIRFAPTIVNLGETGMVYVVVNIRTKKDEIYRRVVIVGGLIVSVDRKKEVPFDPEDIISFEATHDKDRYSEMKRTEHGAPPNRQASGSSTIQPFANAYERFFSIGGRQVSFDVRYEENILVSRRVPSKCGYFRGYRHLCWLCAWTFGAA